MPKDAFTILRTLSVRATYAGLAAFLAAAPASAHPHVWVDTYAEVAFDGQGRIEAIKHSWIFDEAFSVYVIQGLDENGDGVYSREELQPLAQTNVESLSDFAFFTFMGVEEATIDFTDPRDYWLDYDAGNNLLTLNFTLPLQQPALVIGEMVLEIYDPEFFVDFAVNSDDAIRLASTAPSNCGLKVQPRPDIDDAFAALLAELPAEQRDVPDEFFAVTSQLSNSAVITCG